MHSNYIPTNNSVSFIRHTVVLFCTGEWYLKLPLFKRHFSAQLASRCHNEMTCSTEKQMQGLSMFLWLVVNCRLIFALSRNIFPFYYYFYCHVLSKLLSRLRKHGKFNLTVLWSSAISLHCDQMFLFWRGRKMYSFTSEAYNTQLWCSWLQNRMGFELGEPAHFLFLVQTFVLGQSGGKGGSSFLSYSVSACWPPLCWSFSTKDEWTLSASSPSPCR